MTDTINWSRLARAARPYHFEAVNPRIREAFICDFRRTTSSIAQAVREGLGDPERPLERLLIYVDTLVVDEPTLPSAMVEIVARSIEAAPNRRLQVSSGAMSAITVLTSEVHDAPLQLATPTNTWDPEPTDRRPLVLEFASGMGSGRATREPLELADRLRHPLAWNLLESQLEVALLLDTDDTAERVLGFRMLRWVNICASAAASRPREFGFEASDLAAQTTALLVLWAAERRGTFVPVLTSTFYADRIDRLLAVVGSYESAIQSLEVRQDLAQALESVGATLENISTQQRAAVQVALDNTIEELAAQRGRFFALQVEFDTQMRVLDRLEIEFRRGARDAFVWTTLSTLLSIVKAVAGIAAAIKGVAADVSGAKDAATKSFETAQQILALLSETSEDDSSEAGFEVRGTIEFLGEFFKGLKQLASIVEAAAALAEPGRKGWRLLCKGPSAPEVHIPDWADILANDASLHWNRFHMTIDAALDRPVADNVAGARAFRDGLRVLTEYGKAMDRRVSALAELQGRVLDLQAQLDAADHARERWEMLRDGAADNSQRVAILRAQLRSGEVNARRSLLVAGRLFRHAYLYRWMAEPRLSLAMDMSHAQLAEQVASIQKGLGLILEGAGGPDQPFETPDLIIPIVDWDADETPLDQGAGVTRAVRSQRQGITTLSWTISLEQPPFADSLPRHGLRALFLTEAWFFLPGAVPNTAGVVMLEVSTSGIYANGYGDAQDGQRRFSARPLTMDFVYQPRSPGEPTVRVPWRPAAPVQALFMQPSPFTQWSVVVRNAGSLDAVEHLVVRFRGIVRAVER